MQQIHSLTHRLHNADLGILLIRLALGAVFIYHGWQKLQAMDMTIGFFGTLGFAPYLAYVVAYAEFIGGIALVLGIATRYAGLVLAIAMAVATFKVHWSNGFSLATGGYEFAMALMLGSLAMVFLGAGRYSLARIFGRWCECH